MSKSKEKLQQFTTNTTTSSTTITTTKVKNSDFIKMKSDEDKIIDHKGDKKEIISDDMSKLNEKRRRKLKDLNEVITCYLCGGYYIEATTLNDCLHSFCRSCILKHLQYYKYCPKCKMFSGKTDKINYCNLRIDRALSSLVYKVVPGLCQSELQRLVKFITPGYENPTNLYQDLHEFYSPDELVSLSLEYHIKSVIGEQNDTSSLTQIRYLQCPAAVTVHHLQRFLSSKFNLNQNRQFSIDVIYEDEILPNDFSLMDVAYCYQWERLSPMKFYYRIFVRSEKLFNKPSETTISTNKSTLAQQPLQTTIVSTNETFLDNNKFVKNNNNNNYNNNNNNHNKNLNNKDSDSIKIVHKNENHEINVTVENHDYVKQTNEVLENIVINKESFSSKNCNNDKKVNEEPKNILKRSFSSPTSSISLNSSKTKTIISSPPQPPSDFKILRSNDIRYAITPSNNENNEGSSKTKTERRKSKISIKLERSVSEVIETNTSSLLSLPMRRKSNNLTLKRKYNISDDEDEEERKLEHDKLKYKSRSPSEVMNLTELKNKTDSKMSSKHRHHHHHPTYSIVPTSPKNETEKNKKPEEIVKKTHNNVPEIEMDLPSLKAKIRVPKTEKTVTTPLTAITDTNDEKQPKIQENPVTYAKTVGFKPNVSSNDNQHHYHHHHRHHHENNGSSSSHKKRKKSKHSKDSPYDDSNSTNGSSGDGSPNSNGGSSGKRRKLHAEISPQTEKSPDDLKVKFKLTNYKAEKEKKPIPTMIIDDDSSDSIHFTPVPTPLKRSKSKSKKVNPLSLTLPTNKTAKTVNPVEAITVTSSEDIEDVIKRNKIIKKVDNSIPMATVGDENLVKEMVAIHYGNNTQATKPMVNIPHLKPAHLENLHPIYDLLSIQTLMDNPTLAQSQQKIIPQKPSTISQNNNCTNTLSINPNQLSNYRPRNSINRPAFNFIPPPGLSHFTSRPRTPFPHNITKPTNRQNQSSGETNTKKLLSSHELSSIFDFTVDSDDSFVKEKFMKKSDNQKSDTNPTISTTINPLIKQAEEVEAILTAVGKKFNDARSKLNLIPSTSLLTTKPNIENNNNNGKMNQKSESFFKSSIGNTFISENQNFHKTMTPIQLPPVSVSVTKMCDKNTITETQQKNEKNNQNNFNERPALEIVRISSTVPAIDQIQMCNSNNNNNSKSPTKTNRPPPPLIKRPQPINIANNTNGNQKRPSLGNVTANSEHQLKKSPERKNSNDTNITESSNTTPLDLSGKSSRSPSSDDSPKSRSNSIDDISNESKTPEKMSKQKKITDMFPSSSWSIKVENSSHSNNNTNKNGDSNKKSEISISEVVNSDLKLLSPKPNCNDGNTMTNRSQPPKLTEITKIRTVNTTQSSIRSPVSVRQQNLSIRNIPNPSALAFRNQQNLNNIAITSTTMSTATSPTPITTTPTLNNVVKSKSNDGKGIEKVIASLKAAADSNNTKMNLS